jgi:hypothetical protein
VDDEERAARLAEGLDPDDPAVIAAIDLVRWELSLYLHPRPALPLSRSLQWSGAVK